MTSNHSEDNVIHSHYPHSIKTPIPVLALLPIEFFPTIRIKSELKSYLPLLQVEIMIDLIGWPPLSGVSSWRFFASTPKRPERNDSWNVKLVTFDIQFMINFTIGELVESHFVLNFFSLIVKNIFDCHRNVLSDLLSVVVSVLVKSKWVNAFFFAVIVIIVRTFRRKEQQQKEWNGNCKDSEKVHSTGHPFTVDFDHSLTYK